MPSPEIVFVSFHIRFVCDRKKKTNENVIVGSPQTDSPEESTTTWLSEKYTREITTSPDVHTTSLNRTTQLSDITQIMTTEETTSTLSEDRNQSTVLEQISTTTEPFTSSKEMVEPSTEMQATLQETSDGEESSTNNGTMIMSTVETNQTSVEQSTVQQMTGASENDTVSRADGKGTTLTADMTSGATTEISTGTTKSVVGDLAPPNTVSFGGLIFQCVITSYLLLV